METANLHAVMDTFVQLFRNVLRQSLADPTPDIVERVKPAVVAIDKPAGDGWAGTGCIVSGDGLVLSSRHVIGSRADVKVRLADGQVLAGQVVKKDEAMDLVLINIPGSGYQTVRLDDSPVRLGQAVFCLGHPYGYLYTISKGCVSGQGRQVIMPTGAVLEDCLQTDAAVNSGNSGGPMLNYEGGMVGMTFAFRAEAENIGFAIPAARLRPFLT